MKSVLSPVKHLTDLHMFVESKWLAYLGLLHLQLFLVTLILYISVKSGYSHRAQSSAFDPASAQVDKISSPF